MSVQTRRLSKDEFMETFAPKMHNVQETATDVLDIWPYVHSVPTIDLEGHVIYDRFIDGVYRKGDCHFDHVMVMTKTKPVYLGIIIDLTNESIHGYQLLDLNREHGLH